MGLHPMTLLFDRIGIDPGASGALVVIKGEQPVAWLHMPTILDGSATRVDAAVITDFLRQHPHLPVYLERVSAMPKQGIASAFNFGHSAGVVYGLARGLGHPVRMVTPSKWKRKAGLSGTEKDACRSKASMLWPQWKELQAKIKGQALADAAFIACYGD